MTALERALRHDCHVVVADLAFVSFASWLYVLSGAGIGAPSSSGGPMAMSPAWTPDLTHEYVEAGNVLSSWVGLEDLVTLEQGDASATAYADDTFDKAFMLHVGMNIADKSDLALEIYRVLKPGGTLGIYDIMRMDDGELSYPVPWAARPQESALGSPDEYRGALESAGFRTVAERNRRDFAIDFFARLQANVSAADGPPPLGLHILMGETAPTKIRNMVENVTSDRIAPVELIAGKPL